MTHQHPQETARDWKLDVMVEYKDTGMQSTEKKKRL